MNVRDRQAPDYASVLIPIGALALLIFLMLR
jgi:hypothetical protein